MKDGTEVSSKLQKRTQTADTFVKIGVKFCTERLTGNNTMKQKLMTMKLKQVICRQICLSTRAAEIS